MSDFAQDFRTLSGIVEPVEIKITAKKDPGKPYVGLENMPSRGANLLGWEPASSSISTNSVFSKGDVLFGKLRPNLRKCVIAPCDGYCSTDILVLRAKDGVDSGFAGKVFQTEQVGAAAERTAIGTKMPRTSWRHLKEVSVFCPELEEQKLTAQILDTLDTTIRETEALIDKLKAVKQGLLHDLLTRGIDANGQLRPQQNEAPQLYKESPLGWIPREWEVLPLAEVVASTPNAIVDGPFGSNLKTEHYRSHGVPVIQSGYVTSGEFRANTYFFVAPQHFQSQARSRVDPGDIVMAKIGANAGMCAVLPDGHSFGILAGNCMKITTDECIARRDWLVPYLHRLYQVTGMSSVRTETAQPAISLGRLRALHVPVPPTSEQKRAADALSTAQFRLHSELENAATLQKLRSGLMDDLLTGRVRVTPLLESVQQVAAQIVQQPVGQMGA